MLIYKFKGAVMQNPEMIAGIRNEIQKQSENCIVVVSALKGVMPRLRALYALSLKKGSGFEEEFKEFRHVHADLAEHLLAGNKLSEYLEDMQKHLDELYEILHQVAPVKEASQAMKDYILAKGDILSSLLFSKLFENASWKDSRDFVITDSNFGAPEILWEESCEAVSREFRDTGGITVVPGYCGKTKSGYSISLGRVGLSLTAALLESAFQKVKVA
ncbi:amino acid kinase family protein [Culturomica massiliensis]|uniref:amino acid kinase family protein n=1 Tax=Culturomica massiliensis TaxID=1841857 RepID=UPI0026664A17|nr:hypothetical protein [Culturomica massiliensis]